MDRKHTLFAELIETNNLCLLAFLCGGLFRFDHLFHRRFRDFGNFSKSRVFFFILRPCMTNRTLSLPRFASNCTALGML